MYESKIYQPGYHSKKSFMVYNFDLGLFFYFKWFKGYSCLNVIAFYFQSYRNAKKYKLLNFKRT